MNDSEKNASTPLSYRELRRHRKHKDRSGNGYFSFHNMISPFALKVIHIVGLFLIILMSVRLLIRGFGYYKIEILYGFLLLALGPFVWRILCEGWILAFSMHEVLVSIEKKMK